MHRVAAKFVPRLLGEDQKQSRVDVSKEFVDRANADERFFFKDHHQRLWNLGLRL